LLIEGKDGELRIYEYGLVASDIITNGGFSADSDWTKGTDWTISNGAARHGSDVTGILTQNLTLDVDVSEKYKVEYTISAVTAAGGGVNIFLGGEAGTTRTAPGTYTERIIPRFSSAVTIQGGASTDVSIDNVIIIKNDSGTTYYLEALFCEMDFSGPISRPRTEERIIMDRGNFDTNAHYAEGPDDPRYTPIPLSFSCRLSDTVDSRVISDWLSGVTRLSNIAGGTTIIYSFDGTTTIDGNTLPAFADTAKSSFRIEMKWDGTNDLGYRFEEVHFTYGEQSITESADGLMLSGSGQIYGDVTRITAFLSGTSVLAFS